MKPLSISVMSTALAISLGCAVGCNPSSPDAADKFGSPPAADAHLVTFFVEGMI